MAKSSSIPAGMALRAEVPADYASILTPEALDFVAGLARAFEPERERLLARRVQRQAELDRGVRPDFLGETRSVREADWTISPPLPENTNSPPTCSTSWSAPSPYPNF